MPRRTRSDLDTRKRAEVQRLRADGMTLADIGEKLGLSRQRIHILLAEVTEATLDAATVSPSRKTQLRRASQSRCQACGKQMVGRRKLKPTNVLCGDCLAQHNAQTRQKKRAIVAAGLCVNCRKPRDREGRMCNHCKQEYMRRYR